MHEKDVFWALVDLKEAYDTIDRNVMWQIFGMYLVEGNDWRLHDSLQRDMGERQELGKGWTWTHHPGLLSRLLGLLILLHLDDN